ncbi:hypothetical protein FJZ27_04945 [Candidatus Peribacteria bacterium]|nr:hypothetical protein [Candidatus Peribacteria bacterium]
MSSLPFGLAISAALSVTSLLIVLFRVSPLTAPLQAIPALFVSAFLSATTVGALVSIGIWRLIPIHDWDRGRITAIGLRQGLLLGLATTVTLLFLVLRLLNWWIAILIFGVFALIELSSKH